MSRLNIVLVFFALCVNSVFLITKFDVTIRVNDQLTYWLNVNHRCNFSESTKYCQRANLSLAQFYSSEEVVSFRSSQSYCRNTSLSEKVDQKLWTAGYGSVTSKLSETNNHPNGLSCYGLMSELSDEVTLPGVICENRTQIPRVPESIVFGHLTLSEYYMTYNDATNYCDTRNASLSNFVTAKEWNIIERSYLKHRSVNFTQAGIKSIWLMSQTHTTNSSKCLANAYQFNELQYPATYPCDRLLPVLCVNHSVKTKYHWTSNMTPPGAYVLPMYSDVEIGSSKFQCLLSVHDRRTSERFCEKMNATLLKADHVFNVIDDISEDYHLAWLHLDKNSNITASDRTQKLTYWIDPGKLPLELANGKCLTVTVSTDLVWLWKNCSEQLYVICEPITQISMSSVDKRKLMTTNVTISKQINLNERRYFTFDQKMKFFDAIDVCEKNNATIVPGFNQREYKAIDTMIGNDKVSFWLGVHNYSRWQYPTRFLNGTSLTKNDTNSFKANHDFGYFVCNAVHSRRSKTWMSSCEQERIAVCYVDLPEIKPTSATLTTSSIQLPNSYSVVEINGIPFYYSMSTYDKHTADRFCQKLNATIIKVDHIFDVYEDLLENYDHSVLRPGEHSKKALRDYKSKPVFWIDPGTPPLELANDKCLTVTVSADLIWLWEDCDRYSLFSLICEPMSPFNITTNGIRQSMLTNMNISKSVESNGRRYFTFAEKVKFFEAIELCKRYNAKIVPGFNQGEYKTIQDMIGNELLSYWIGAQNFSKWDYPSRYLDDTKLSRSDISRFVDGGDYGFSQCNAVQTRKSKTWSSSCYQKRKAVCFIDLLDIQPIRVEDSSFNVMNIWLYVIGLLFILVTIGTVIWMINRFGRHSVKLYNGTIIERKLIIPFDKLIIGDFLGKGNFGHVHKGVYCKNGTKLTVAIKTLIDDGDLLSEALLMTKVNHQNVMPLVGIFFTGRKCLGLPRIVMPFMENHDLKTWLTDEKNEPILSELITFCLDIAKGMESLAFHHLVHRDLAARNCMVDNYLRIKISDFGLAREVDENSDYYRSSDMRMRLPFRWTAPEAMANRKFDQSTDVWSYGVTVWEILNRGKQPYEEIEYAKDILSFLNDGNRLPIEPCEDLSEMNDLMLDCWQADPTKRPPFKLIRKKISLLCAVNEPTYENSKMIQLYDYMIDGDYYENPVNSVP